MKVALLDKDVEHAARLAVLIKRLSNISVEYYEDMGNSTISTSSIVLADPSPELTSVWLERFRSIHKNVPLVLMSYNTDLLSGSFKDRCYAFSKPINPEDILALLKFHAMGRVYPGDVKDGKRPN